MDIARRTHWDKINTERKEQTHRGAAGLRTWWNKTPATQIFYKIADRFFKKNAKKSVLEVGCAPGKRLLEFAGRYQYRPYGVEYTKVGVDCVREEFAKRRIPPEQCIYSDVFDPAFQEKHHNKFDAVISFGFIEHFTNVDEVISAHIKPLKPGGLLLIMIPNLRGIYYPLLKYFAPELIDIHNITIMQKKAFTQLFAGKKVKPLFLGYYGVLNFGMLQARGGKIRNLILKGLRVGQVFFNPILRHCHVLENGLTSPYLLFIGRKK